MCWTTGAPQKRLISYSNEAFEAHTQIATISNMPHTLKYSTTSQIYLNLQNIVFYQIRYITLSVISHTFTNISTHFQIYNTLSSQIYLRLSNISNVPKFISLSDISLTLYNICRLSTIYEYLQYPRHSASIKYPILSNISHSL